MPDNVPAAAQSANQKSIITHAVLVGLTPLIPVPFVDDMLQAYFQRRLVRSLAAAHGRVLSTEEVAALAEERGGGCLRGCLGQLILYPLKKISRKILFFLEWKRAIDLTSRAYHQGYMVECALREGWLADPANRNARSAMDVRAAIEEVCRESPVKPVEAAIGASFRQSKSMLLAGARVLEQAFKRVTGRPDERQLAERVAAVEQEEERELAGIVGRLQKAIGAIPEEHFRSLRTRLAARLRIPLIEANDKIIHRDTRGFMK